LSDEDQDQYSWTLGYHSPNFIFDYLGVFNREELSLAGAAPSPPYPAGSFITRQKQDTWTTSFYSMAKLGPVKLEGEFGYTHGYISEVGINGVVSDPSNDDIEIDTMAWFLQATFDGGPFDIYTGWAHTDGDADGSSDVAKEALLGSNQDINSYSGQFGDDWDLLFFMTSDEGSHARNFGGIGNWSATGANPYGLDLWYIGGGFDISPTVNISAVWGIGWADAVPTGDKDVGNEFDLWLTWQIMDGLQYKALFAFFDAGDFWRDAANYNYGAFGPVYLQSHDNVSDSGTAWALMHQLTLSF
jgi:hypothetical protein